MPDLRWYFDPISPFAWLQWPRIAALAAERPVQLRPILFAALLDHHGHKGPAEIPAKRRFTYRYVSWRAARDGRPLRFPPAHPFNPLPALRLIVAAGSTPPAVDAVLRFVWESGQAADSVEAIAPLAARLGVEDTAAALSAAEVKQGLLAHGEEARELGVFGVPTLLVDGELFWGEDATDMALEWLRDPAAARQRYAATDTLPEAVQRRPAR
ncbi:2-hydroxychromene-2-carboxylate isomerase [Pseudomarimonas salicorniae]|uniref:2-hydroxychromene-2-carboxylate isomerase n=1 Tax=Pseudomarimonas salicorniae TaxID=2933270 RepID=A0ABT0GGP8_9GAMM|nr:DsbA family protein [Lysobacter sp. CAU 1642]MCK7593190.1 DsbA family protein [Lysobacter sp. CAU 1642]